MSNKYIRSLISSALSVIPMILIVLILSFLPNGNLKVDSAIGNTIVPLEGYDYLALCLGGLILIIGLNLFQVGAEKSLTKVGEVMGSSLSRQSKIFIVIIFSFLLGALITCAEPSILIIANQVNINSLVLIGSIALGVGIFVVIGVLRIILHASLKVWYIVFYLVVFMLICLIAVDDSSRQFLPFIFDAGGITTGSATVPFILALGTGIAIVRGKNISEDSFGLVGMASIGPILTMALLILFNKSGFSAYCVPDPQIFSDAGQIFKVIGQALLPSGGDHLGSLIEVAMALIPIMLIFFIYEVIFIKLPKKEIKAIIYGFLISYIGLVIFLTGVGAIMTPFGTKVGFALGEIKNNWIIILVCFVIGLVTILCEPAVHVLTEQISVISDGLIKKGTVLFALAIGVGLAIGLATLRSLTPSFNIMYIIVPGYLISIVLMFLTPNLFTAVGFDAGGTASGPMSVSFVLPIIIGITKVKFNYPSKDIVYYTQSFGVVALIALIPILTIQLMGVVMTRKKYYAFKVMSGKIKDPNDDQIIHFR